jgi:putative glutamine amidotransferase
MLASMREEIGAPLIVITVGDPALSSDPALTERKHQLYCDAVARHGGNPALLTTATPPAERERLLAAMRGLLLSGGADIDPALYGEKAEGASGMDPARDQLELEAWRVAARRSVPVLGICRGMQAINVFSGGKLLQDVPTHGGVAYGQGPTSLHPLQIDPTSELGRLIAAAAPDGVAGGDETDDTLELDVNTFHHQAVTPDLLAAGLRATAWASSEAGRLVEGLERSDGDQWVMAIQCHPERTDSTPLAFESLFGAFVKASSAGPVRHSSEVA